MKISKSRGGRAVLTSLILILLGTFGLNAQASSGANGKDTLVVDIATPPASLDPAAVASIEDLGLLSDLYPTLTKHAIDASLPGDSQQENSAEVVPYLADSWDVSADGKVYTFHLHKGAQFPSGAPIDSSAVKWSWNRAFAAGTTGAYFISGGSKVVSLDTPDVQTLVVTLAGPAPDYLAALTSVGAAVVDRTVLEKNGSTADEQNKWLASHFAGGGPYVIESYQAGTSLTLKANPSFWGPAPRHSRVAIRFISDDSTLLLRARNGQSDVTLGLTKQAVSSLKTNTKVKIIDKPAAAWELVGLPNKLPPFDNVKFREALTYATPQADLVKKVAFGYGQAFYGPFPPAFAAFNADLSKPRPFDLAKAKALIAESGVKGPVKADLYIRDGINDQKQIATVLQDTWKGLGIQLTIRQLSAAEYQQAVGAPEKKWLIVRFDGPSITTPGWLSSYDTFSGSPYNQSNYSNPQVDQLIQAANNELSASARQRIWDQLTQLWIADSPRVLAYAQNYTVILKKDIGQNDLLFHLWGR